MGFQSASLDTILASAGVTKGALYRKRLAIIFDPWRDAVVSVLGEGQTHGRVRSDVEPADAVGLLIAMVEGYGALAKNAQDPRVMKAAIRNIVHWLRSLRPPGNRKRV